MNQDNKHPPFRAEHVGSFPRPDRLLKARQDYSEAKISKEDLKRTVAECIREIVLLQERVGIGAITDGAFPKKSWHEFLFENVMVSIRNGQNRISSSDFSMERNSNTRASH